LMILCFFSPLPHWGKGQGEGEPLMPWCIGLKDIIDSVFGF
jgi:hypothetical protein